MAHINSTQYTLYNINQSCSNPTDSEFCLANSNISSCSSSVTVNGVCRTSKTLCSLGPCNAVPPYSKLSSSSSQILFLRQRQKMTTTLEHMIMNPTTPMAIIISNS